MGPRTDPNLPRWTLRAVPLWGPIAASRRENSDFYHEKRVRKMKEKMAAKGWPVRAARRKGPELGEAGRPAWGRPGTKVQGGASGQGGKT